MSRPVFALVHEGAGRLEPAWLGLRSEPTSDADSPRGPDPAAAFVRGPFVPGSLNLAGVSIEVAIEVEAHIAWIQLELRNDTAHPVAIPSVGLGFLWTPPNTNGLRYLRHGWQSWSLTETRALDETGEAPFPSGPWLRGFHHAVGAPPLDRQGWHESDLVTVVGEALGGSACLLGAYERGVGFATVYARAQGQQIALELEHQLEVELPAGASMRLEPVRVALGGDASVLLEDYASDYGRRVGARVTQPFVSGWCSWYTAFANVTEDDIRRNLDALVAMRDEIPVEVVQIDDGYQRAVGDWRAPNAKFPRGLAPLAEEIRGAGFVPGLWTAPFCVVPESELFQTHPDWLLADGSSPFRAMVHMDWSRDGSVYGLDLERPDVLAFLEELYRELTDWGFQYHKLDFLFVGAARVREGAGAISRAARLRAGLSAIRAGVGDEAFLLGCGCPLGAAVGLVDGMRIGPDVAPHWDPDAGSAIPGIEETLPSARGSLRSTLLHTWMHRRLWLNDPDCLMVRGRDTALVDSERRALATAIAGTGGMVVVSDDLPALSPSERSLWQKTVEGSHAVDRGGVPGRARVTNLLADGIPKRIDANLEEFCTQAHVHTREHAEPIPIPAGARVQIGSEPRNAAIALEAHDGALLVTEPAAAFAIFCDFDGTFSIQDVGSCLAQRYGGDRRAAEWARYERGEITPWEYNLEILDGLPVPLPELDEFLQEVRLNPGAKELIAWCSTHDFPFRILSDGFDWNLNRLQRIHDVQFAYCANRLRYDAGHWRVAPGHPNPECGCGTGTCKRGIIEAYRARHPDTFTVHIGNGRVSDTCGALAAHHVFAKDSLGPELERRGASFQPFETLYDVIEGLEALRAGSATSG